MLLAIVLTVSCTVFASAANESISVVLDGEPVQFDVKPMLIGGRTMVPMRAILEAMETVVLWDESTQTVTAYNEAYVVKATIGSYAININGKDSTIDVPPMIVGGRTLVPARFISEAFGCDVRWDAGSLTVVITSKPIDYNDVETSDSTINPKVENSVYDDSVTSRVYYPGTSVPDYTYVTGIEMKRAPHYSEDASSVVYVYEHTKTGEFYEVVDYMAYLSRNGWTLYEEEEDYTSLYWAYTRDDELMIVCYKEKYSEIWITTGS